MSKGTSPLLPRKLATAGAIGGAIYVAGQLFNLGFQFLLINFIGKAAYGHIGLAHLLMTLLIFNADLGYGLYFLRQAPNEPTWQKHWQLATGHRLAVVALLIPAVLFFWGWRYGIENLGFCYLAAAAPGAFLSIFNFASPLIAAGRYRVGIALQQILWPAGFVMFLLFSSTAQTASPQVLAVAAGACVSIAYCLQAIVNFAAMNFNVRLITPSYRREGWPILATAFKLSLLGVIGSLHDRLTPFLIEPISPYFLPIYIVLLQMLAGASGVANQFYRLLIAHASRGSESTHKVKNLISLFTIAASLFFLVLALVVLIAPLSPPKESLTLAWIVLLGWMTEITGGLLASVIIGRAEETFFFRYFIIGTTMSVVLQLAAYQLSSADMIIWGRVIGNLAIIFFALRHLQLSFPSSLILLFLPVFLITSSHLSPFWTLLAIPSLALIAFAQARALRRESSST